ARARPCVPSRAQRLAERGGVLVLHAAARVGVVAGAVDALGGEELGAARAAARDLCALRRLGARRAGAGAATGSVARVGRFAVAGGGRRRRRGLLLRLVVAHVLVERGLILVGHAAARAGGVAAAVGASGGEVAGAVGARAADLGALRRVAAAAAG